MTDRGFGSLVSPAGGGPTAPGPARAMHDSDKPLHPIEQAIAPQSDALEEAWQAADPFVHVVPFGTPAGRYSGTSACGIKREFTVGKGPASCPDCLAGMQAAKDARERGRRKAREAAERQREQQIPPEQPRGPVP